MKTKKLVGLKVVIALVALIVCTTVNAQVKYDSNGRFTIGDTTPYGFYAQTIFGNGMYFKCKTSNFFQIDVTPASTRLASHSDQVVFYNTQSSVFNSIQVKNVYNYSDARAKSNIQSLNNGLNSILKLRPVSYTFADQADRSIFKTGGNGLEIGLLAQEVEAVLPNIVLTDPDGKKLINYTAIIPILIDAIKTLQQEVEVLKQNK
jgi:hypothetical protein